MNDSTTSQNPCYAAILRWTCILGLLAVSTLMFWQLMADWRIGEQSGSRADRQFDTLLLAIAEGDAARVCKVFGEGNVPVNAVDGMGVTPLGHAVAAGLRNDPAIIQALLEHGADVDVADGFGDTPLMYAVSLHDQHTAAHLLKAGAQLNLRRRDGTTVLHCAVFSECDPAMFEMLLKAGADREVRDQAGQTPADYARAAGLIESATTIDRCLSDQGFVSSANHARSN
jgi:ankyrin repeat protein